MAQILEVLSCKYWMTGSDLSLVILNTTYIMGT